MTELLDLDRLDGIARVSDGPGPRWVVPTLQWRIDPATGRPVGRWVLDAAPGATVEDDRRGR